MRNILEYPLTTAEATGILTEIKDELNKSPCIGDIRSYAIDWVIRKLQATEGGNYPISVNFLF